MSEAQWALRNALPDGAGCYWCGVTLTRANVSQLTKDCNATMCCKVCRWKRTPAQREALFTRRGRSPKQKKGR